MNKMQAFKYHINPLQSEVFKTDQSVICACCEKETDIYYDGGVFCECEEEIDFLCPECIISGKAHDKFDCEFIEDWEIVDDELKTEELRFKNPGIVTWQGEIWPAHCNDYCAFVDYVGWKEIVAMGIEKDVEENYMQNDEFDIAQVKDSLIDGGDMQGYLFVCLHCGKHRLCVDSD